MNTDLLLCPPMHLSDFHYELPQELIAQYPAEQRSDSRLLYMPADEVLADKQIRDLPDLLRAGDLMVFNNTRVIPARLFGQKESGGKVEVLVERLLADNRILAHIRASKSPRPGVVLKLEGDVMAEVISRQDNLFELQFDPQCHLMELLEQSGRIPLPPYIKREDDSVDRERYQTVYAEHAGAVAAPTAGLHFDDALLDQLKQTGIEFAFVTLHVGSGTFQPVRTDRIEDHIMHSEYLEVTQAVCDQVVATRKRGGRVVAVGTTSVRCLETAADNGQCQAFSGDTDIFIYPGYQFQVVDVLLTNFHLPESTLLMLVSAFAGKDRIMAAYQHAIEQRYRFFSYGDAMLIEKSDE